MKNKALILIIIVILLTIPFHSNIAKISTELDLIEFKNNLKNKYIENDEISFREIDKNNIAKFLWSYDDNCGCDNESRLYHPIILCSILKAILLPIIKFLYFYALTINLEIMSRFVEFVAGVYIMLYILLNC